MKEMEIFMETVALGLKLMAKGIESVAEKVESFAKSQREEAPEEKEPADLTAEVPQKEPAEKAPAVVPQKEPEEKVPAEVFPEKPVVKAAKPETAADTILSIIEKYDKGVDLATLKKETGFESKKISNIAYKLKKQGKIKNKKKGIYVKA